MADRRYTDHVITTTTLRYQPVGDVRLDFDDLNVNAGVGAHRLVLPMTHSAAWLAADSAADPTPALLLGSAWVETRASDG